MTTRTARLNTGPVEVLFLRQHEVYLIAYDSQDGHFATGMMDSHITVSKVHYRSVPGKQVGCRMSPEKIAELYPLIADDHQKFIQLAAERRKKTTWGPSFSPGVIRYLNDLLETNVPMPSYYRRQTGGEALFPDQAGTEKTYFEGAVSKVLVNSYERNPKARRDCIARHGAKCSVCDFSFEKMYGTLGKDFIHVHHLQLLSEINEEYEVDPVADLRPVCPNCHVMLHRRAPSLSIEELKRLIMEHSQRDQGATQPSSHPNPARSTRILRVR